jgi:hypothetical protein
MSDHYEGVCTPDTMVCALVRGSAKDIRGEIEGSKPLIFMHFHGMFLGSQHEIWSKKHNGKVSSVQPDIPLYHPRTLPLYTRERGITKSAEDPGGHGGVCTLTAQACPG